MTGLNSYLVVAVIVNLALLLCMKGDIRRHLANLLILLCTIGTVLFFGQIAKGESGQSRLRSQVIEERAESTLRLMTTINVGVAKVYELFGPIKDSGGKAHSAIDVGKTGLSTYFKTSKLALQEAIRANPTKAELKSKLVVLLSVWGKDKKLARETCDSLRTSNIESEKTLGDLLWNVFIIKSSEKGADFDKGIEILKSGIPKGWYQDYAILSYCKVSGNFKRYESYISQLEERYSNSFRLGLAIAVFGSFSAFVGLIVIVIQLGSFARKDPELPDDEKMGLDISLKTVYSVFVGWLTAELAIAEFVKLLPKGMIALSANPLGIALFSFISYLVTMLPALLLVYLLAFRPQSTNPLKALKLRFRTPKLGPFKIVFAGILSWTAIIPFVLVSSSLSAFIGLQGSDNPVLPQIAALASSGNIAAILLLLCTVSVLAPLCEEIIFRGFLYSVLRKKIGIFAAVVLSALVFAGIHFDKGGAIMLFSLGPVLAMSYERSRSLVPPIIAHGMWNGGAFAFTLVLYGS